MDDWHLKPAADLGMPVGQRLRSVRRERGTIPWLMHLIVWVVLKSLLQIFHRLQIEDRENLPKDGSFVLVANHSSHLDTLVLATALPWRTRSDAFPVAAGDTFFKTRMTAVLSTLFVNALPMWRRGAVNHSLTDLRERLAGDRCILIIFPEGTRSRDGTMGRFKSGLGMIVAGTRVPVVPCRLWGTFDAWPSGRRLPRPKRVRLKIGRPLEFEKIGNDRAGWDEIARNVEAAVLKLQ